MRQLTVGDEFCGCQIEAIAGRGGMGLVYRARQRRPERTVALKVIVPELAADPGFRTRFEQESTAAAQIEHPNVVPVYAVGEEDGLLYLTMRFVDGVDLGALRAQQGRLEPSRAIHLVAQAADALDAAHARGLVHRDVKPGNILVAARDHVYLTDFGLTKRTADTQRMTKTGMFIGSLDYIAPEQIEGRGVDARADVYSLGCVLFELLSGSVPFPRDSDVAKIFAHVYEPPPHLEGVPEPLARAVARAMAKRPEDRFPSAGEFASAALARIEAPPAAQAPTTEAEAGPGDDTVAPTRRTPPGRQQVTVVVVDDHPFFRDGVRRALERSGRMTVVAEAANGREALETIRRERPMVALVDYEMPEMDGISLVHAVVSERLSTRVLLLSAIVESGTVFRAVEEGAAGYLSKDARRQDIVDGVLRAARGDTVVPAELGAGLAAEIRQRAQSQARAARGTGGLG
ncbi:MAG: protein kinase [Solirubrobacterales bacterium]|nr:protein kinase [Solirubrobacterales bacterium]MBV9716268.1 protein kinase [Solirubrobacterales bacterium]